MKDVNKQFREKTENCYAEYLLQSQNPLTAISDSWISENEFLNGQRSLRPDEISFSGEIDQDDHLLNFYVNTDFNVDEVFGTNVMTAENDDFLNIYANYDLDQDCVCDTLIVVLNYADGKMYDYKYRLNAEEQVAVTQKMDAYCAEQLGVSLAECREQYLVEDAQPTQNLTI